MGGSTRCDYEWNLQATSGTIRMRSDSRSIVQKLWSYCNILRDDGLSYPDYVEQLTYLLFLKMAHERSATDPTRPPIVPEEYGWTSLTTERGPALQRQYSTILHQLGLATGMLGIIFRGAENKIRDPAKLRLLIVDLIDRRNWSALDTDIKGDAYEGLLEKNAQDTKSGAGQYFTPRPLVRAIVQCVRPDLGEAIYDPACGTGGFLLGAHEYILATHRDLSNNQLAELRLRTFHGGELVPEVTRLGTMNLLLHGIGPTDDEEGPPPIETVDSLAARPPRSYDVVLTNPPFGRRSSVTVVTSQYERRDYERSVVREDFWVSTANKELNFLQHVAAVLKPGGRAAIVVPDGVLSGGGAGESLRRRLLDEFEVHTLLRLPNGIFYASGVNANVLFFDRPVSRRPSGDGQLWVYDLRTNMHFTLVTNRLSYEPLSDFVSRYSGADRGSRTATWSVETPQGKWRAFDIADLIQREGCNWDWLWIRQDDLSHDEDSRSVEDLTREIIDELQLAIARLAELAATPEITDVEGAPYPRPSARDQ